MSAARPGQELIDVLGERVLGSGMGASFVRHAVGERKAFAPVAIWLIVYAWVCAAIFLPAGAPDWAGSLKVRSLLVWGVVYFAGAIYLAQTTTRAVIRTVADDVLPHARPGYVVSVTNGLRRRYPTGWTLRRAAPPALIALGFAVWAISVDLRLGWPAAYRPDLLFWAATYFLYFLTAAMSVDATRFYMEFARHLEKESDRFYVLGATDSPLVRGLAKLANQILVFHSSMFLLLASGMLLAIIPEPYALSGSWLLLLMVPTSCFFSLGFGAIVFVGTERKIRSLLQRFALKHAAYLQEMSNSLLSPGDGIVSDETEEIRRLTEWQDRILAGGRYGSRLGTVISVALPFLVPLLSLLIRIVEGGAG